MTAPRFKSFEEFWPYYVLEHSQKATRHFHFVGTAAALTTAAYGVLSGRYKALLLAPLCGYGPAWVSHFFIENNRPATFDYPLWSARGDFLMFAKMLQGTMDEEVARCAAAAAEAAQAAATADAPQPDPDQPVDDQPAPAPARVAAINAPPLN